MFVSTVEVVVFLVDGMNFLTCKYSFLFSGGCKFFTDECIVYPCEEVVHQNVPNKDYCCLMVNTFVATNAMLSWV